MNPPTVWLALAGTCVVGAGVVSLLPPQAASTHALAIQARIEVFFMLCAPASTRARDRRAEIREPRQERTVRLDLRTGLIHAVVQVVHRSTQRDRARLARGSELERIV